MVLECTFRKPQAQVIDSLFRGNDRSATVLSPPIPGELKASEDDYPPGPPGSAGSGLVTWLKQ